MSDLLTTTRVNAGLAFETAVQARRAASATRRGQTAAEYMGVLLVVSVIIAAVATTASARDIKNKMSDARQLHRQGQGRQAGAAAARRRQGGKAGR